MVQGFSHINVTFESSGMMAKCEGRKGMNKRVGGNMTSVREAYDTSSVFGIVKWRRLVSPGNGESVYEARNES